MAEDEYLWVSREVTDQQEPLSPERGNGKKENGEESQTGNGQHKRREEKAFEWVLETLDDLFSERDPEENVWGSMVKQALKRRKPGFSERYHGFRSFSELLEKMEEKKMVQLEHDQKSGGYIITDYMGA